MVRMSNYDGLQWPAMACNGTQIWIDMEDLGPSITHLMRSLLRILHICTRHVIDVFPKPQRLMSSLLADSRVEGMFEPGFDVDEVERASVKWGLTSEATASPVNDDDWVFTFLVAVAVISTIGVCAVGVWSLRRGRGGAAKSNIASSFELT